MGRLQKHPPGHPTGFKNPTTGAKELGEIVDEVWLREPDDFDQVAPDNSGWREAAFLAQRLKYPDGYRAVRITYYVRSTGQGADDWRFAGQYAPTMPEQDFKLFFNKIAAAGWLRE